MNITKPFLILQLRPEDETSESEFKAFLKYGELQEHQVKRIRIEKAGIPALSLKDYSGIIVGGSPFDISTAEEKKLAIQKKIETDFHQLFDKIISTDFPFLGACSGNGLLGAYLGTSISGKYAEAVGAVEVCLTPEGTKDALLAGFPDKITVLLGHKEACDTIPTGATLLIKGTTCPVQMFRLGNNVYATQFHPEGDAEGFTLRIHTYKNFGYFQPEQAEHFIKVVHSAETVYAQKILKRFVERYGS